MVIVSFFPLFGLFLFPLRVGRGVGESEEGVGSQLGAVLLGMRIVVTLGT